MDAGVPPAGEFGVKMRSQKYKDGDVDYEARFWMCIRTVCPTILVEALFFDNLDEGEKSGDGIRFPRLDQPVELLS